MKVGKNVMSHLLIGIKKKGIRKLLEHCNTFNLKLIQREIVQTKLIKNNFTYIGNMLTMFTINSHILQARIFELNFVPTIFPTILSASM